MLVRVTVALAILTITTSTSATHAQRIERFSTEAPSHPRPSSAPAAIAILPPRATSAASARDVVLFLHGWGCCVEALAAARHTACSPEGPTRPGWNLAHAARRTTLPIVLVQLAWATRDSSAGRFAEPAFVSSFLQALFVWLRSLEALGEGPIRIHLVSHSAGYRAALGILAADVPHAAVESAYFLDSFYEGEIELTAWLNSSTTHRAMTLYTQGSTRSHSLALARGLQIEGRPGPALTLSDALERYRVVIAHTELRHGALPARLMATLIADVSRSHPPRPYGSVDGVLIDNVAVE